MKKKFSKIVYNRMSITLPDNSVLHFWITRVFFSFNSFSFKWYNVEGVWIIGKTWLKKGKYSKKVCKPLQYSIVPVQNEYGVNGVTEWHEVSWLGVVLHFSLVTGCGYGLGMEHFIWNWKNLHSSAKSLQSN